MESIKEQMLVALDKTIPWWYSTSVLCPTDTEGTAGQFSWMLNLEGGRDGLKQTSPTSWVCRGWACPRFFPKFIFQGWFILCDDSGPWFGFGRVQLSPSLCVILAGSLAFSGFDSMGHSLYLRKVSEVRLILSVGWCGLRLHWKRKQLLLACSPSLTSFIWRFLPIWFSNGMIRDPQNCLGETQIMLSFSVGRYFPCKYLERHSLGFEVFWGLTGVGACGFSPKEKLRNSVVG